MKTAPAFNTNSFANKLYSQFKLMCKLNLKNKTAMVTFKEMTLTIIENGSIIHQKKYKLGDMGVYRYCSTIMKYQKKGYDIEGRIDNIDEVFKNMKK